MITGGGESDILQKMKPYNYLQNKRLKFVLILSLLLPLLLFGEQKNLPLKDIKSIIIKAPHLNLKIIKRQSPVYTIKWNGDFSFQNKENKLTILTRNFNSKKSWTVSSKPPPTLQISGPAAPVQLFSFSSNSSFSRWTKSMFISSFKGKIKASNTQGPWKISLKKGSVNIHQHQGSLSVQGFHVNHFLASSKGHFQFYINEGQLKVKKSEGELDFTTDKAEIHLTRFKGNLKGFSQSGAIIATVQPKTVELSTGESPLRVSFMGWAPRITAYTEKGRIYGSRYLYKQFSGKSTKVSGRIKGSPKQGDVSLKTETGNIYIN